MSNLPRWKVTCSGEKNDEILHHVQDLWTLLDGQCHNAAIALSAQLNGSSSHLNRLSFASQAYLHVMRVISCIFQRD